MKMSKIISSLCVLGVMVSSGYAAQNPQAPSPTPLKKAAKASAASEFAENNGSTRSGPVETNRETRLDSTTGNAYQQNRVEGRQGARDSRQDARQENQTTRQANRNSTTSTTTGSSTTSSTTSGTTGSSTTSSTASGSTASSATGS